MIKTILNGTILSILTFFSTSFLTVLFQINSPLNRVTDNHELNIGFPFIYYQEFMIDCPIPNSGWTISNLIWDCLITWIAVTGAFVIIKRIRKWTCYNDSYETSRKKLFTQKIKMIVGIISILIVLLFLFIRNLWISPSLPNLREYQKKTYIRI